MKCVCAISKDGTTATWPSAQQCADAIGTTVQCVSHACVHGSLCKGLRLRYVNPFTGETLPHGHGHTCLSMAEPVVRRLAGQHADEALAYMRSKKPERMSEVKLCFFKWWLTVKIPIASDDWVEAWGTGRAPSETPL